MANQKIEIMSREEVHAEQKILHEELSSIRHGSYRDTAIAKAREKQITDRLDELFQISKNALSENPPRTALHDILPDILRQQGLHEEAENFEKDHPKQA